jgi:hypothetical protein
MELHMPIAVGLHPVPANFAKQVFSPIWGDDWLTQWASRTRYSALELDEWLADGNADQHEQRLLDGMAYLQLDLELRRLQMAIQNNAQQAAALYKSSDGNAPYLVRLYEDCESMQMSQLLIENLLFSVGTRIEVYEAWVAHVGDPDQPE